MSDDSPSSRPDPRRPLTRRGKAPFIAQAVVSPLAPPGERKTRPLDGEVFNAIASYHRFHQAETQPIPQFPPEILEELPLLADLEAFRMRDTEILPVMKVPEDEEATAPSPSSDDQAAPSQPLPAFTSPPPRTTQRLGAIDLESELVASPGPQPSDKPSVPPVVRRHAPPTRLPTTPEVLDAITEFVSARHPRPKLPPAAPAPSSLDLVLTPETKAALASPTQARPHAGPVRLPTPPNTQALEGAVKVPSTPSQPHLPAASTPSPTPFQQAETLLDQPAVPSIASKRPTLRSATLPAHKPVSVQPPAQASHPTLPPDTLQESRPSLAPESTQALAPTPAPKNPAPAHSKPQVPDTIQELRPMLTPESPAAPSKPQVPDTIQELRPLLTPSLPKSAEALKTQGASLADPALSDTREQLHPALSVTQEQPSPALSATQEQPSPTLPPVAHAMNPGLMDTMEQVRPVLPDTLQDLPSLASTTHDLARHSPLETLWPEVENEQPLLSKTTPVNPLRLQVTEIIPAIPDPDQPHELPDDLVALMAELRAKGDALTSELQAELAQTESHLTSEGEDADAQLHSASPNQTLPRLRPITPEDLAASRLASVVEDPAPPAPRAERVPTLGFHRDSIEEIVGSTKAAPALLEPASTPLERPFESPKPHANQTEEQRFRSQTTELHPRVSPAKALPGLMPEKLDGSDLINPTPHELQRLLDKTEGKGLAPVAVKSFREQATELHPRIKDEQDVDFGPIDPQLERTDLRPRIEDNTKAKRHSLLEPLVILHKDYDPSDTAPSQDHYVTPATPSSKSAQAVPLWVLWVILVALALGLAFVFFA